ncbi:hypothetical protein T439DRAFT_328391 [Meredithblackwellia eburnea MCA 4105]
MNQKKLIISSSHATQVNERQPVAIKRAYGAACAECKRCRRRCIWPEEGVVAPPTSCLPCNLKGTRCPGRFKRAQATTKSRSLSSITIRPSGAAHRATSAVAAELLSQDLLTVYLSHWNVQPFMKSIQGLFQKAAGRPERLSETEKTTYFSTLSLAARSSANPAIVGPSAPPLCDIDSGRVDQSVDLSVFGRSRVGPCTALSRKALDAFHEAAMLNNVKIEALAEMASISAFISLEGEHSQEVITPAVRLFRKVWSRELRPDQRRLWSLLGRTLLMIDASTACSAACPPIFSNSEAEAISPRRRTSLPEADLLYIDFVRHSLESYPYPAFMNSAFSAINAEKIWIARDVSIILASSTSHVQSTLPKIWDAWSSFRKSREETNSKRNFINVVRSQTVEAGLGYSALSRVDVLTSVVANVAGKATLAQFHVHAALKQWKLEGAFIPAEMMDKCIEETRASIKYVAAAFHDYTLRPQASTVPISQTFRGMDSAIDWVDIALERLPANRKQEEVSLEELTWLVTGLRQATWTYSRAEVRLRELEQGVIAIREEQFAEQLKVDAFLDQYLHLSAL